MTKIDIFSGFLGAGKTTLIKKLLKEAYAGEKVVLIENEFGEIGIDGGFLKESGVQINEMNSGCICCSLVGDFSRSLAEVLSKFSPDRILVEPSGVGKLSDVVRAVSTVLSNDVVIGSKITVVDVNKGKMYLKNFGEFFGDQIENAGTIVLSHTDACSEEKTNLCVDLLRTLNDKATIITTPWPQLDGALILATAQKENALQNALQSLEEETRHHHHDDDEECECHHHHHHDEDDDDEECECHHHHHDDDDEECECHHHHHDGDDDEECECHHHHHDGDDDEECECHHHHHDEDDDDEHEHHHHDGEECGCGCHHGHGHHHADDVFDSFGFETARKYTKDEIQSVLTIFAEGTQYGMVLRAKGILPAKDGTWIHFDYVPGEPDVRNGTADVTGRLCVIGTGLDKDGIARLFGKA